MYLSPGKILEKSWEFVSEKGYEPCVCRLSNARPVGPHFESNSPLYGANLWSNARVGGMGTLGFDSGLTDT